MRWLFVTFLFLSIPARGWTIPKVDPVRDMERFQRALKLLQGDPPDPASALALLERNIEETPGADYADYDLGWAMVCCARLEKFRSALQYYRTLRRKHHGWLGEEKGPAVRNWECCHAETLELARKAAARNREAGEIAAWMERYDVEAQAALLEETVDLVRRTGAGEAGAASRLRSCPRRYGSVLVELMARGRLRLAE